MLAPSDWFNITQWGWPGDLVMWAGVVTAAGVIYRQVAWPVFKAFWQAITAAPRIASDMNEIVELLRGDVLNKLDRIQEHAMQHEQEAAERDRRLDHHTVQLESHQLSLSALDTRLGKVEAALAGKPLE